MRALSNWRCASFPGLRRLFLSFHVASPTGPSTAPGLFARLAQGACRSGFRGFGRLGAQGAATRSPRRMARPVAELAASATCSATISARCGSSSTRKAMSSSQPIATTISASGISVTINSNSSTPSRCWKLRVSRKRKTTRHRPTVTRRIEGLEEPLGRLLGSGAGAGRGPCRTIPRIRLCQADATSRSGCRWSEYQPRPGSAERIARLRTRSARISSAGSRRSFCSARARSRAERMRRQPEGEFLDIDASSMRQSRGSIR